MHSVSDLTTFARKTKGDVPPPLVGASTTVVGNKMYLFGGRLVSLRKMVSDMYVFDLETFIWTKVEPKADDDVPGPRYFHSADAWNDHLVIFGGMGYVAPDSEDLCVLSDVRLFSLSSFSWLPAAPVQTAAEDSASGQPVPAPRARYAHLSSITASKLFIIGGQDLSNVWLDDIHVYDLPSATWVMWRSYPRHCGTYRSVAVCAPRRVRSPMDEIKAANAANGNGAASPPPQGYPFLGPVGARFTPDRAAPGTATRLGANAAIDTAPEGPTPTRELVHLPYSCDPTDEYPNDIYLYSNYNFTDVKRELESITPMITDFTITDQSLNMGGASLPPGLRFPTGAILGQHLVIAGTYLAHSYQSFSIWALNLVDMTWSRIDPGATLGTGSWSRGVLWERGNRFLIFGNKEGNLVEDYNRRLLSWDHVAYIDLEAFGIYQPPELVLSLAAQEMGLAALEEGVCADFDVICEDGRRIAVSRRLLEERWEWFRLARKNFANGVSSALDKMPGHGRARGDIPLPDVPGVLVDGSRERPDPRLTPRSLQLSEPYPITLAFMQWMYTQALVTRVQHAPPVLSALLLLGTTYSLKALEAQVKHAMHRALSPTTSVGVYEVATLCDCQSLQIRALKVVMSSSKQRSLARPRHGPQNGPDDGGARPRGMSDAPARPSRSGDGGSGTRLGGMYGSAPPPSSVLSGSTNGYGRQTGLSIDMPRISKENVEKAPDSGNKFAVTSPYAGGPGAGYFEAMNSASSPPLDGHAFHSINRESGNSGRNLHLSPGPYSPAHLSKRLHGSISEEPHSKHSGSHILRPVTVSSAFTALSDVTDLTATTTSTDPLDSEGDDDDDDGSNSNYRMQRLLTELDTVADLRPSRHELEPESKEYAYNGSVHGHGPTFSQGYGRQAIIRPTGVRQTIDNSSAFHQPPRSLTHNHQALPPRPPVSQSRLQDYHGMQELEPIPAVPSQKDVVHFEPSPVVALPPQLNPQFAPVKGPLPTQIVTGGGKMMQPPPTYPGPPAGSPPPLLSRNLRGRMGSASGKEILTPVMDQNPVSSPVQAPYSPELPALTPLSPVSAPLSAVSGANVPLSRIDEKKPLNVDISANNTITPKTDIKGSNTTGEANLTLKATLSPSTTVAPSIITTVTSNSGQSGNSAPSVVSGRATPAGGRKPSYDPSMSAYHMGMSAFGGGGFSFGGGLFGGGKSAPRPASSKSGSDHTNSFTDQQNPGKDTKDVKEVSPTVAMASAFVGVDTGSGGALTKAERAAQKAAEKAEKAAKKAEEARIKLEREKDAAKLRVQQEEAKRAAVEVKRQAAEAKRREKEERLRQAEQAMARLDAVAGSLFRT